MFLIVLVDVLGFTIVIPLLSLYAERFGAEPLVATLIVSCYAASSLVSTPNPRAGSPISTAAVPCS